MLDKLTLIESELKVSSASHTMGKSLLPYIEMKMHQEIKNNVSKTVVILGDNSRVDWEVSKFEKNNKLFNWKRPSVEVLADSLIVKCYPGQDYIFHYASLISTYYHLLKKDIKVYYSLPSEEDCQNELAKSSLKEVPTTEVTILGYVEQLSSLIPTQEWQGEGDFIYKQGKVNSTSITLLGCKHSYWADISGRITSQLANQGSSLVIYIGKLGSLNPSHKANEVLTTGNSSFLQGEIVKWNNVFSTNHPNIVEGKHYSLPSIIQESIEWKKSVEADYDFVDPEIGYMTKAAVNNNIDFSYLHICSDNLSSTQSEDLSNERKLSVISKRASLLNVAKEALLNLF